ncbi:MAG: ATP-binding cassette domain-containing protein [Clostridia bacterium]
MLQVNNVTVQFGTRKLMEDVNLKFTQGNCYGVIGANGAGKSTFLRVISGNLEPNTGNVTIDKNKRMSVLAQNQNAFDTYTVLDTVVSGHEKLFSIMKEKEALYAKEDFTDEDGIRAGELESEFGDLGGWEAESEAQILLNDLKIPEDHQYVLMEDIDAKEKVKILLARALFGKPDILILDEPTNNLDSKSIIWLENFLMEFKNTLIIVSHNRHFLNKVCTHICDVDYGEIRIFVGNYDFWYESSQLIARQQKDQNASMEQRAKELQEFIARFSANASKSKQATSRKKELEKLTIENIKPSMRKYPFIDFKFEKMIGKEILTVENLTKKGYFENISFTMQKDDKIALIGNNSLAIEMLFSVLAGKEEADSGQIMWGKSIIPTYLPENYDNYFDNCHLSLIDWVGQFSKDNHEEFLRSWLGRMLFSGEEAKKEACVLSGGEKVRCMLAKMMLEQGNFLIMDEPTNHLDLESITALNKGMVNFKGDMIFTSHDHEIIQTVANRIMEIENGKKIFDREIAYDDYIELT